MTAFLLVVTLLSMVFLTLTEREEKTHLLLRVEEHVDVEDNLEEKREENMESLLSCSSLSRDVSTISLRY